MTPSASASAVPLRLVIDTSSSSASSHVAGALDFMSVSAVRSVARTSGEGTLTRGRSRPAARVTSPTIASWLSVSGPASS